MKEGIQFALTLPPSVAKEIDEFSATFKVAPHLTAIFAALIILQSEGMTTADRDRLSKELDDALRIMDKEGNVKAKLELVKR